MSQPRSAGKSVTASVSSRTSRHSSSGPSAPPGYRQPIPTIATGSSAASSSSLFRRRSRSFSLSEARSASTTFSGDFAMLFRSGSR